MPIADSSRQGLVRAKGSWLASFIRWALRTDFIHGLLPTPEAHRHLGPDTSHPASLDAPHQSAFIIHLCRADAQTGLQQNQIQETSNFYCLPDEAGGPSLGS
jgi:hypothetical protein